MELGKLKRHSTLSKRLLAFTLLTATLLGILLSLIFFLPLPGQVLDSDYWTTENQKAKDAHFSYSKHYNISFWGIEKLHPFDSQKYRRVKKALIKEGSLTEADFLKPARPSWEFLKNYHSNQYLQNLYKPDKLAHVTEIGVLKYLPWRLIHRKVVGPMLMATGGSLIAAKTALRLGWAINLGGGFHHAHRADGGGFCMFADISMIAGELRKNSELQRVAIIDLDAHQGNGHGRDFIDDTETYILDMYNADIYPHDEFAKRGIDKKIELRSGVGDAEYLSLLDGALASSFSEFDPQFVIYNAGTDSLRGDPLGLMDLSPEAIIQRDEKVFRAAIDRNIPIVMLLSGGYQPSNADVIASSIGNLLKTVLNK